MFPANNNDSNGFTLVETLVATLIASIVLVGVTQFFSTYQVHRWGQESAADALKSKEVAAEIIRSQFPRTISANSTSDPITNSAVWSCPSGGPCTLTSSVQNGVRVSVSCQSTSGITHLKDTSLNSAANLRTNCSSCAQGTRPVMTVTLYSGGSATRTVTFPDPNVANKSKGLLGMGLCFAAPSYTEDSITKWDRWRVTLVPMYYGLPPKTTLSSTEYNKLLRVKPEDILMSGLSQLGPGMMIIE